MEAPQKDIFQYWNGERAVYGDPLVILRIMSKELDGNSKEIWDLTQSENPNQANEAADKIIKAAHKAFAMVPFVHGSESDNGATNEIVFSVLGQFFSWWAKKKPTIANSPTLPPVTV